MPLDAILDRRLLIISGKGGVGKTTIAAAIGVLAARHNRRVLIAEVEGKENLPRLFGAPPLTATPAPLRYNLSAMTVDPEEALQEYFEVQFHMKRLARPLVTSQLVDYVTHTAPGLRDILLLGKVWYAATRRKQFDVIVMDTPAAGHAVSMLRSPEGFLHAVPVGPLANHTRQVLAWLQDPEHVSIHLACLPEELPVTETIETVLAVEDQLKMNVSHIFMNMVWPPFSEDPSVNAKIEKMKSAAALKKRGSLTAQQAEELYNLTEFYRSRRAVQQGHREAMAEAVSRTASIVELPYLFTEAFGEAEVDAIADEIEKQL